MGVNEVICADCLEAMRDMPEGGVDAIVTDPPYGLGFMGVAWDTFGDGKGRPRTKATFDHVGGNHHPTCAADQARTRGVENRRLQSAMTPVFTEALRVAKPGAHLLCFGGARTYHRMACAIEDAGWEVRDCIMWVYGSGMPHGQRVDRLMERGHPDAAPEWEGWGTCLKPAWEPIIVARKPLDGTVANNVLKYGTGAMNIDACRVPTDEDISTHGDGSSEQKSAAVYGSYKGDRPRKSKGQEIGRYPANLVHDGSRQVLDLFPDSRGQLASLSGREPSRPAKNVYGEYGRHSFGRRGDSGSAARFFYCAKASKRERGEGNDHPCVKPLALMKWLVRLVTPEDAIVLDPFCGSGSTLVAAKRLGRGFIGIDMEREYCEIALRRLEGVVSCDT